MSISMLIAWQSDLLNAVCTVAWHDIDNEELRCRSGRLCLSWSMSFGRHQKFVHIRKPKSSIKMPGCLSILAPCAAGRVPQEEAAAAAAAAAATALHL